MIKERQLQLILRLSQSLGEVHGECEFCMDFVLNSDSLVGFPGQNSLPPEIGIIRFRDERVLMRPVTPIMVCGKEWNVAKPRELPTSEGTIVVGSQEIIFEIYNPGPVWIPRKNKATKTEFPC